ncbi:MAG: glycosyltransferase family 2 protein [Terracidiphilus sp.]
MKISVCMATYNGARFIHEQLASILTQLDSDDEIILVDDASTDATVFIAEGFSDKRIRVLRQTHNCGVLKTFERTLREAAGDIIFLADQDDVWRGDKVAKVKRVFQTHADLSLVLSDCAIIDAMGEVVATTRFKSGKFHPGALHNIVRNSYLGCSMAFRRPILEYCLPFPVDIPMHDMWIGILNQLVSKNGYIDEPLMSYRRHDRNSSPEKHAPVAQMIRWRLALVKNLILRYRQAALFRRQISANRSL